MTDSPRDGIAAEDHTVRGKDPTDDASLAAIVADVRHLWDESAAQARGVSELAFLELNLAATSLRRMLWATLVLAGLALTIWGFLLAAVTAALIEHGLSLSVSLLVGAMANAAAAAALMAFIRTLAQDIQFRNLRRYLSKQSHESTT